MRTVAVIGGGPAGMIAAAEAARRGSDVTLFEHNEKLGKKLFITGKGRCNITNTAGKDEFFNNVARNGRFLYSALDSFSSADIVELINREGVKTKVERGDRVFPESDKSSDVIKALASNLKKSGAHTELNADVEGIGANNGFIVCVNGVKRRFDRVILATGGMSYRSTGSTGDGYRFAKSLGHTVNEPCGALVPLETNEDWPIRMQGLTLKNVTLSAYKGGKRIFRELGEMLFTHFGVSGPLVLTLSSIIADAPEGIKCFIDLKPGLEAHELDKRVLRDFEANTRKQLKNSLGALLPVNMIPVIIELNGIDPAASVDSITREQRRNFCELLKAVPFTVKRAGKLDEAIVTRGGVSVKEINPSTMESKLVKGLFFAGEIMDVDAFTGGFNLQIAYSTGFLAGRSAGGE